MRGALKSQGLFSLTNPLTKLKLSLTKFMKIA